MSDVQLKIVDGPDAGREFPVAGTVVIGRDPSAGIVLEDSEASRRHAQVTPRSGGVAVEDLGSTNGTFVNGEQVAGERMLLGGERIRIGTTVLEVSVPVQATKIASVVQEEPDPGATKMASVMTPEEAEKAAAAAQSAPADEDDEPTQVPDPEPAPAAAALPGTEAPAGPQSPAPPAAAPPTPPAPQSPAAGPGFQPPPPPPPGGAPYAAPPQQQALAQQPVQAQPPAGYQAGPGFQVRGPGEQWALCALVPFYALVWYYRLCKEIGEWSQGRIDVNPALSTVAVSIGAYVIVPPFVSYAGTAGRIRQCQQMAGLEPTVSFGAVFGRMLLFGYGYKWLTEQLNELAVRRPVQ